MIFTDKIVVLTGATGGIGHEIALALASQGATLLLVARNSELLKDLASLCGAGHHWLSADVASAQGRQAVLDKATEIKANVLINNAGVSQFDAIENISEQQFRDTLEINLMAPVILTRGFLRQVSCGNPRTVVNVGSALGSIGFPFYTSYCAGKFALRGFSEALGRELAQSQDRILYFAPRATQTKLNSAAVDEMNRRLGNSIDSPAVVAQALVKQLSKGIRRASMGWPEGLFAKINALLPQLVDQALSKKLKNIRQFVRT